MSLPIPNLPAAAPIAQPVVPPTKEVASPAQSPAAPFQVNATAPQTGATPANAAPRTAGVAPASAAPAAGRHDAAAHVGKVERTGQTARAESANPFQELEQHQARLRDFLGRPKPATAEEKLQRMEDLMLLSEDGRQIQFKVELISKVVEQATGGARTIMQTQA